MLTMDVKVGDALKIEGVGVVRVGFKSGQQVRLVIDVDKQYAVHLAKQDKQTAPNLTR